MKVSTDLTEMFDLELPIIMAPMFLVTNEAMMQSAMDAGIAGCFPSLNHRKSGELNAVLKNLNQYKERYKCRGVVGVNLIVQKTNPLYHEHLKICIENKVAFYITSLGNPAEVIEKAHRYGAKVFCDVTNMKHARKVASLGCDGFIAVTLGAGGHAGPYAPAVLVAALKEEFPEIPVILAGGIATGSGILSALALGASGVSIGTRFIASTEASVSQEYKQAVVDAGMEDIFMTERLSGTPCAVINTPYAKKLGTHQNFFERWMSNNPRTKKYFKMLVQIRGMKKLEEAVKPGNYHNLWSAGQSVELIHDILPCSDIISRMKKELVEAKSATDKLFKDHDAASSITE
jgi:nitronate monooxygenase